MTFQPTETRPHPMVFDHFVGQQAAVETLVNAVEDSLRRGVRMPHTLLAGEDNIGKSTLARIAACELGEGFALVPAMSLLSPDHLWQALTDKTEGRVLVLTDLQELSPAGQRHLAYALHRDNLCDIPGVGMNPSEDMAEAPIVLATISNNLKIDTALQQVFSIKVHLTRYGIQEIRRILDQYSRRARIPVANQVTGALAKQCLGSPGIAVTFLESARRRASANGRDQVEVMDVKAVLNTEFANVVGLNRLYSIYLTTLRKAGGQIAKTLLQAKLKWPTDSFGRVERSLLRAGTIECKGAEIHLTGIPRILP